MNDPYQIIREHLDARQIQNEITDTDYNLCLSFLEETNNSSQRRREPIIIEYYVREPYGRKCEYIKDPGQARIIQNLTRQKTINGVIRELLRDLTGNHIIWKQIIAP